jgi:hypothetical protein
MNAAQKSLASKRGMITLKVAMGEFKRLSQPSLDGLEVEVQQPQSLAQEKAYLKETAAQDYRDRQAAQARLLELLRMKDTTLKRIMLSTTVF